MNEIYLVSVETVIKQDTGHCSILHESYWVNAEGKQKAAAGAAQHVRERYGSDHMHDRVVRVLAKKDWGEKYFDYINR